MNTRKKMIKAGARTDILIKIMLALAVSACTGCSRYAPVPAPVVKQKIMEIQVQTAAPVANNFYYYFAFDTSNPLKTEGPLPILSTSERGKNWTYYIRYYNGIFTEKKIEKAGDIDEEPTLFNHTSERFYQTSVSENTILIRMYVDKLTTPPNSVAFNFITSEQPIMPASEDIPAIDYFYQPRVSISTLTGIYIDNTLQVLSSNHIVNDEKYFPADIISWHVDIYER